MSCLAESHGSSDLPIAWVASLELAMDIQVSEGGTYRQSPIPGNVFECGYVSAKSDSRIIFRACYGSGPRGRYVLGKSDSRERLQ